MDPDIWVQLGWRMNFGAPFTGTSDAAEKSRDIKFNYFQPDQENPCTITYILLPNLSSGKNKVIYRSMLYFIFEYLKAVILLLKERK